MNQSNDAPLVHVTVLLEEAVDALAIVPDGVYVDCTFGRGGHSRLILSRLSKTGRLIAFDKDPEAIKVGRKLMAEDPRFTLVHAGFAGFDAVLTELKIEKVNGVLMDLGISSPQIDEGLRGFSFRFDAPLDMRMDTTRGLTAAEWLATASEADIREVIKNYGEERFARQIAANLVAQRQEKPITTTRELANLVAQNVRSKDFAQDPATRTFQAIRIFINRELEELESVLPQAAQRLLVDGRLVVLSFHSLEDRIAKLFIRSAMTVDTAPRHLPIRAADLGEPRLLAIGRAIRASATEIAQNPRARSVVMRVAQRTDAPWL
jgi:16S rRNA (cytosine1402-N4)-methyltransferase